MTKRIRLAEIDRLIEVLDNTRFGPPPRAEIETLRAAYISARCIEERARVIYGCATIILIIGWVVYAFTIGSLDFPDWFNPTMLGLLTIHLVALSLFTFLLPVLRRRERVAFLLEYFERDLTSVDEPFARKTAPPVVLHAIEVLERASSPAELGQSYARVEKWSGRVHGWDLDGVYVAFLWALAVVVGVSGDQFGLPDFLRGIIIGGAGVAAFYQLNRSREERGIRQRAEDALGRWRHLVPKLRELPS